LKKKLAAAVLSFSILLTMGTGSAFADSKMDKVIDKALGTKYAAGGVSTNGFDCSGFTMYVFDKIGINLPHQSGVRLKVPYDPSENRRSIHPKLVPPFP